MRRTTVAESGFYIETIERSTFCRANGRGCGREIQLGRSKHQYRPDNGRLRQSVPSRRQKACRQAKSAIKFPASRLSFAHQVYGHQ
jgi:hypothetical protein